jgi:hypothetical protein
VSHYERTKWLAYDGSKLTSLFKYAVLPQFSELRALPSRSSPPRYAALSVDEDIRIIVIRSHRALEGREEKKKKKKEGE